MIIEPKSPSQPFEPPPSYDTLVPLNSRLLSDVKRTPSQNPSSSSSYGRSPPITPTSPAASSSSKGKGKASAWFNYAVNRTAREVHGTVLGLVRDLLREHYADSSAPAGILQSCADACAAHELQLSTILQEHSIENHTPLYWAIVKRKPDEQLDESCQVPDLLTALLSHSTPLSPEAIADIRLACLVTSDQRLFQRLRMSPEFSMVSGADQMLLGVTQSQDEIEVHEVAADDGSFAVDLVIPHFQKRMMVTQRIELEFIARSRMWKLCFLVARPYEYPGIQGNSWCITVSLQPHSPPTWLDAQLVILDPNPAEPSTSPSSPSPTPSRLFGLSPSSSAAPAAVPIPKPPIKIRFKDDWHQLEAPRTFFSNGKAIAVAIDNNPTAATLQYSGTSYIASDERLRARFEAKLRKPENDNDCVIC